MTAIKIQHEEFIKLRYPARFSHMR